MPLVGGDRGDLGIARQVDDRGTCCRLPGGHRDRVEVQAEGRDLEATACGQVERDVLLVGDRSPDEKHGRTRAAPVGTQVLRHLLHRGGVFGCVGGDDDAVGVGLISKSSASVTRRNDAILAAYGAGSHRWSRSRSSKAVPSTPNRSLITTWIPHLASTAWISALH